MNSEKKVFAPVVLTGDRPTGKLHLGHYVGSIKNRIKLQDKYEKAYYMVADIQALTDNFNNPEKVRENVLEVVIDNIASGVDPNKTTMFIQSMIPEIAELTVLFMNLVTVNQLRHNPTIKTEIKERNYEESIPLGFLAYPVSQTADISFCKGNIIPVGADQIPVIEQANEIVKKFNNNYGEVFPYIEVIVGETGRLVGIDGNAKASKSLGNAIYLAEESDEIVKKVMNMYTDPDHININDPGKVDGNVVFAYLDTFDDNVDEITELKQRYMVGGLGDVEVKKRLIDVLESIISPIREKRKLLEKDRDAVKEILFAGVLQAREVAQKTMSEVRKAMHIDY